MTQEDFKRNLAAICSIDVEGFSRLMDDEEEATVRTPTTFRNTITDLIEVRVETLAEAGGICISRRIYDMIENKLELDYAYMGSIRSRT